MSRRVARDEAVKILYQIAIQKDTEPMDAYEPRKGLEEIDISYIRSTVQGVLEKNDALVEKISAHSQKRAVDRIPLLIMAILKLALYEMEALEDIPQSVSINEAIELTKKYDSAEGGTFVNGILGAMIREQEQ